MLSCIDKINYSNNKILGEYCKNYTLASVKRVVDNYNLERKKPKINNLFNDDDNNDKPNFNFYGVLAFLSMSSFAYLIYKRIK